MYDPGSRLIVTHRINDERLAEARRAHLLRGDRDDAPTFTARDTVRAGHSLIGRVSAALHHATGPALTQRHATR